jgi:uncharacterized protein (TIGR02271 family)
MADSQSNAPTLGKLSDLDYEVASGEPDVRGWTVVIANDEEIGKVIDLVVDPQAGKVRYLDVDLDRSGLGLDRDRQVLVPIGSAQLDEEDDRVVLSGFTRAAVLNLPDSGESLRGRGFETRFPSHSDTDSTPRRMTRSAEELRIGRRTEQKGEVRVSKHVETERVRQNVPLTSEEVEVERRPVEHAARSAPELRNEEIRVPVMEEEAVVEKRPVLKEEVVIKKKAVTRQQPVETDVRREELDIEPSSSEIRTKDDLKRRGGE